MFRIVITEQAYDDLRERYLWIAERAGDDAADDYDERVRRRIMSLVDFPERGARRGEGENLRGLSFERTMIILYRIDADARSVQILRVVMAMRDMALLRFS